VFDGLGKNYLSSPNGAPSPVWGIAPGKIENPMQQSPNGGDINFFPGGGLA
jgi:hypothetical protein